MRSFLKALLFVFFIFFPQAGLSKIYIEPYVGYSFTVIGFENFSPEVYQESEPLLDQVQTGIQEITSKSYYHGVTPGMRLGYTALNLAVGLDFTFGYWKSLYKEGRSNFRGQQTINPVFPGIFVSYKLPLFFRAYAALIPLAHVRIHTQDRSQVCKQSRAMKLGFSYLSLPFLSINFEYLPMFIGGMGDCQVWSHTGSIYGNITF